MTMTAYTFISYTFSHLGDTDFLQLQSEKSQGRFQVGSVGGHRSVYLNRTTMTEKKTAFWQTPQISLQPCERHEGWSHRWEDSAIGALYRFIVKDAFSVNSLIIVYIIKLNVTVVLLNQVRLQQVTDSYTSTVTNNLPLFDGT